MQGSRLFVSALITVLISSAAPITYTSVSCSINNQSVIDDHTCSLSANLPPPYESGRAYAFAAAAGGVVRVAAWGNTDLAGTSFWSSATARFDTYELILSPGAVRPGWAMVWGDFSGGGGDSVSYGSIRFGDYECSGGGGSTVYLNPNTPFRANAPVPVTLGVPLLIHLHGRSEAYGDSAGFSITAAAAGIDVMFRYSLFEVDGVTAVPVVSLELPEPSFAMPFAIVFAGLIYAGRRRHL